MEHAEEIFTMQLARAAGKTANRFLRTRGLQKADRDDVIGAAMLWCWQNRATSSLTTTLETWFMNAVRDAYKKMTRKELPPSDYSINELSGADDTHNVAAAMSAAEALIHALTPVDREIVLLTMQGYTREEIHQRGFSTRSLHAANKRVRQLRRLLPDQETRDTLRRTNNGATPRVPDPDKFDYQPSNIDTEIAQLDFSPPAGKDCPPCWKCTWYYGFLPDGKLGTRLKIEDQEVREAVRVTEARKIEIAQQVRSGSWV